jgi:hypothetical protein
MPEITPVLPVPLVRDAHVGDGREDFDFLFGTWHVAHRKLAVMVDPACTDWLEFDSTGTAHPILGGLGNIDTVVSPDAQGFSLRLFDPARRLWRIWWTSTNQPGVLDPPVEGRFTDGVGLFEGPDVVAGVPVVMRFHWRPGPTTARWSQEFSRDGGATWWTNWIMDFTRAAG